MYIHLFYDACLVSCAVALRRNDQHIYWVIVRVSNLQILYYVFVLQEAKNNQHLLKG